MEKNEKTTVFQRIYAYFSLHKSKSMYITISQSDECITVPWLLAILCLLVFDIPSWILGVLLILLLVFDLDLSITDAKKNEKSSSPNTTLKKSENKSNSKINDKIKVDEDGFCEIIIN